MSVASYINYHRKPFQQFVSIADYNERHGTSIPANQAFESAFQSALADARRVTDPHDYIQHHFNVEKMRMSARGLSNKRSTNYGGSGGGIGSSKKLPSDSGDVPEYTPAEIEDAINRAYERGDDIEKKKKEAEMEAINERRKAKAKRRGSPSSSRPWTSDYEKGDTVYLSADGGKTFDKEGTVMSVEKNVSVKVMPSDQGWALISTLKGYITGDDGSITIDKWENIETEAQHREKKLERLDNMEFTSEIPPKLNPSGAKIGDPSLFQEEEVVNYDAVGLLVDKEDMWNTILPVDKLSVGFFSASDVEEIRQFVKRIIIDEGVRSFSELKGVYQKGNKKARRPDEVTGDKEFYLNHRGVIDPFLKDYDFYIADWLTLESQDTDNKIEQRFRYLAQLPERRVELDGRKPYSLLKSKDNLTREVTEIAMGAKGQSPKPPRRQSESFKQRLNEFDMVNRYENKNMSKFFSKARQEAARIKGVENAKKNVQPVAGGSMKTRSGRGQDVNAPDAFDSLDAALEGEYDDETLTEASSAAPQAVPSTPAVAPAAPAPKAPSLHEEINAYLRTGAKDESAFERDRAHVVHFNTTSMNLPSRLMKGRDRYMKRLQAYVDGDTSVKVRMMDNKEVLVSSLKPNMASLKKMLAASSGAPRFCDCA